MEMTIGELASGQDSRPQRGRYHEEVKLLPRPARASGRRVFESLRQDFSVPATPG